MTGMKNLPRDIQNLANEQGWDEEDLIGRMADFIVQNSLDDDLLEFLQEEAEQSGGDVKDEYDDEEADSDGDS